MQLKQLPTEQRNQDTLRIDAVSTLEMVQMFNREDKKVAEAIERHLPAIAAAIDAVSAAYAAGGRIVYCGAGTSGRLGFMDSSECPPTFGISPDRVVALLAGGLEAVAQAKEGVEDSTELCAEDMRAIGFSKADVLVGLAASGRTPYVVGGMEYARSLGALTVSITCNESPDCPVNALADYPIGIYAGPEAVTGSTRMKSGTVQKLVLNMLSTGVMIRTGKVYSNLMVNVQLSNLKLVDRAKRIIFDVTGAEESEIVRALAESENQVSLAIFMLLTGSDAAAARAALAESDGSVRRALRAAGKE